MTALPNWMRPPREEGWLADDLDSLTSAPRHTELIHGALVFRHWPHHAWHRRVVTAMAAALAARAPARLEIRRGITVRLDHHNRVEPDLVAVTTPVHPDRSRLAPEQVALVVEVVSPETAHRDRAVKFPKYAEAGIPHYWRIEEENHRPVAHVYELAHSYVPAGIFRGKLDRPVPFPVSIDLDGLVGGR